MVHVLTSAQNMNNWETDKIPFQSSTCHCQIANAFRLDLWANTKTVHQFWHHILHILAPSSSSFSSSSSYSQNKWTTSPVTPTVCFISPPRKPQFNPTQSRGTTKCGTVKHVLRHRRGIPFCFYDTIKRGFWVCALSSKVSNIGSLPFSLLLPKLPLLQLHYIKPYF